MARRGQQTVLLAQLIEAEGKQHRIDRQRSQLTGKIIDTRKIAVRGSEHTFAIVDGGDRGKIAVDLGPADKLKADLKNGSQLTFTGVPVKIEGRHLIMAQTLNVDGKTVQVQRMQRKEEVGAPDRQLQETDKK